MNLISFCVVFSKSDFSLSGWENLKVHGEAEYCSGASGSTADIQTVQLVVLGAFSFLFTLSLVTALMHELTYYLKNSGTVREQNQLTETGRSSSIKTRIMQAFCIQKNFMNLFDEKRADLTAIDGMKSLATLWVLIHHTYYEPENRELFQSSLQLQTYPHMVILADVILNSTAVDTFFLITAMLSCRSIMTRMSRSGGQFNIPNLILNRFLRLAPALWFTAASLMMIPLLAQGPFYPLVTKNKVEACVNIEYLVKILLLDMSPGGSTQCLSHTWYLTADLQLYLVSLLIIPVLYWYVSCESLFQLIVQLISIFVRYLGDVHMD